MKTLVFLALLAVVGLVITGAIKMQKSSNNTISIQIDEDRVGEEARRAVNEGEQILHQAEAAVQSPQNGVQK
jgi:Tfp pilus assembly protein PilX